MSYLRNYILIALALYVISALQYFLQVSVLWTPWYTLKTTNLFIMYYMERLYAHTKKLLYNVPFVGTRGGDMEDVRDKMNR